MHKFAVLCFLVGMVVIPVSAIVVQDYSAAEAAPSASGLDLDWGYVYNYKGSSAVSVGEGWLLTAKHVADDPGTGALDLDGTDYLQQQIVYHPTADLALVRFDKAFPGFYDLYTGYVPANLGDTKLSVLMVGYGTTGSVDSVYWTASGSGKGIKRWGSQQIDNSNGSGNEFSMFFNQSSTTYEAGAGTGDSGGGVFYKDGATWKLAGINVAIGSNIDGLNRTDAVSMPFYADWVAETIPEPAAVGLIGFGSIGLLLARAKRQRKLSGRALFPIRRDEPLCDRFYAMYEDEVAVGRWKQIGYIEILFKPGALSRITLLSASMKQFRSARNRISGTFSNCMLRVYQYGVDRLGTIRWAVMRGGARGLDFFLDKLSYDKMVNKINSRRESVPHAVKRDAFKGLDHFLDKTGFDKVVLTKKRLKKSIRSVIRKLCMDYSSKNS